MSFVLSALILVLIVQTIWSPIINLLLPRLNEKWVYSGDRTNFLGHFALNEDVDVDWYQKRSNEKLHLPIKDGEWRPKEFAFVCAHAVPPSKFDTFSARIAAAASHGFRTHKRWHRAYVGVCIVPTGIMQKPKTWWFHRGISRLSVPRLGYEETPSAEEVALVSTGTTNARYRVIVRGHIR